MAPDLGSPRSQGNNGNFFQRMMLINLRRMIPFAVLVFILFFLFVFHDAPSRLFPITPLPTASKGFEGSQFNGSDSMLLEKLGLSRTFEYSHYCFRPVQKSGMGRQSLVTMTQRLPLPASSDLLTVTDVGESLPTCTSHFELEVPRFNTRTGSETRTLLLGVATTLSRIGTSLPELARWLSHTGSRLLVLVVDQPDLDVNFQEVESVYVTAKDLGIDLVLKPYPNPDDSEGLKNFGLAEPLWAEAQKLPHVQWIGIIDDDTFFVSLAQMVESLQKFDPKTPLYLGHLTEGWTRVTNEGNKAWGGAGFFLTLPLLNELVQHTEDCKSLDTGFGDILWRDCIYQLTSPTVRLTQIEGLNQIDLWKDISGWYEAGHNPLLTVHHWKSWHFHPIPAAHVVTDVAGPDSFLQRYLFVNDDIVLTNGFSFVRYPKGVPNLNQVELTMTEDVGLERSPDWKEFHFSLGRTRPALRLGEEKVSWRFVTATKDVDGSVRQFYLRKGEGVDATDSLVEIDWTNW